MVDVKLTGELIGDEHILGVGYTKDDHIVGIEDNLRLRGGSWANKAWDAYDQFQRFKKRRYYDQYLVAARDREIMGYNTPRGPGQSYDIHYEYNPKKVRKDLGRAGLLSAAVIARRLRKRLRRSEDRAKGKAYGSGGDPKKANTNTKSMPLPLRDSVGYGPINEYATKGSEVLRKMNSMTRMYHSLMKYQMSIVKIGANSGTSNPVHTLTSGQGPCLYTTYNYTYTSGTPTTRNWNFNQPNDNDATFEGAHGATTYKGVGTTSVCYIFAADWPFLVMNHDANTQGTGSGQLYWANDEVDTTTDPNLPIKLADFISNKDWTYLTVYRVSYTFDFTNYDIRPYIVEILLFKFKADPDAMDYSDQVTAPFQHQKGGFQEYVNNPSRIWQAPDIKIIKRKRLYIRGMDNNYAQLQSPQKSWGIPQGGSNARRYQLDVNRQYVMKRPILDEYTSLTEAQFFGDYYEPHKGIYCRMQAWPACVNSGLVRPMDSVSIETYDGLDTLCKPENDSTGTKLAPGVDVRIMKKASFKFDAPRIKTLST